MKEVAELLKECNEFIEDNPSEYGLEITVRDAKIISIALRMLIEFEGGEKDAGREEGTGNRN